MSYDSLMYVPNTRQIYYATFDHYSEKTAYDHVGKIIKVPTLILTDIKDKSGNIICDKQSFNRGIAFSRLYLEPGDIVSFTASTLSYPDIDRYSSKNGNLSFNEYSTKYKLANPRKIKKTGLKSIVKRIKG